MTTPPPEDVSRPLVHVGLTAYRRATYIGEAIESVVNQTLPAWELTVSDNGPGAPEIRAAVEPYLADPRISYVTTGRELPLAENWTKALNGGTAPYVAVLNDDDRYHPDYLRRRVEALEAHPECGYAFSEWIGIDADGHVILDVPPKFATGVLPRELLARWFTRQNLLVPPSIVLRRSACEDVGAYFDPAWHYCDWELWARVAAKHPAYYLAEPDNDYRRHDKANTFETREDAERLLAMLDTIEGHFRRSLDGFSLSRNERARNRSRILLNSAGDTYRAGGWKAAAPLYRRAVTVYPPTVFAYPSLSLLGRSLLGERGSQAVSRALRLVRGNGTSPGTT